MCISVRTFIIVIWIVPRDVQVWMTLYRYMYSSGIPTLSLRFNPLTTNVPNIWKPVSWFVEQINWVLSVWWEYWSLRAATVVWKKSSHRRCSIWKDFIKTLAKFTGKYLCQCLFLNKVAGLRPIEQFGGLEPSCRSFSI